DGRTTDVEHLVRLARRVQRRTAGRASVQQLDVAVAAGLRRGRRIGDVRAVAVDRDRAAVERLGTDPVEVLAGTFVVGRDRTDELPLEGAVAAAGTGQVDAVRDLSARSDPDRRGLGHD